MKEIKKLILYVDNTNKQRFQETGISEDEMKQIQHGLIIEQRVNNGLSIDKANPENLPYILLLKKVNNIRNGNTNVFDRSIYFYENQKENAKNNLIRSFNQIMAGRDEKSLQNLGFLTKENISFVNSLQPAKIKEKITKKEVKDNDKKGNYRSND